jgi:hypothetical protein
LTGFDLGTQSKFSPLCGLARGNIQPPEVLDLFSEHKISQFNFLVDLKVQSKGCQSGHHTIAQRKK